MHPPVIKHMLESVACVFVSTHSICPSQPLSVAVQLNELVELVRQSVRGNKSMTSPLKSGSTLFYPPHFNAPQARYRFFVGSLLNIIVLLPEMERKWKQD